MALHQEQLLDLLEFRDKIHKRWKEEYCLLETMNREEIESPVGQDIIQCMKVLENLATFTEKQLKREL